MMIKIDSNNIVTSWCTVGGIDGGIPVDSIPDEVQSAPIGYYKYIDGEFVINAEYTPPTEEPTEVEILKQQVEDLGKTVLSVIGIL